MKRKRATSSDEEPSPKRKKTSARITYSIIQKCQITRKKLIQTYEKSYFQNYCIGGIIRVNLGGDDNYSIGFIDKIIKCEDYEMGNKKFNMKFEAYVNEGKRKCVINTVSNGEISMNEFEMFENMVNRMNVKEINNMNLIKAIEKRKALTSKVTFETVRKCQIKKSVLDQIIEDNSRFELMCKNSFVRICIGINKCSSQRTYRMAYVEGVSYRGFRGLKVRIGKKVKIIKFRIVSNVLIKESEYKFFMKFFTSKIPSEYEATEHYNNDLFHHLQELDKPPPLPAIPKLRISNFVTAINAKIPIVFYDEDAKKLTPEESEIEKLLKDRIIILQNLYTNY